MKTSIECMECNVKQLIKVSNFINVSSKDKEIAAKRLFKHLSNVSYEKTNPEIMGESFQIFQEVFKQENPYKEIKSSYNKFLLNMEKTIREMINESDSPLDVALRVAVIGNIIDFGARHTFSKEEVLKRLNKASEIQFAKDDSEQLFNSLKTAKTSLYIGDNCGEIVMDKLFIETMKKHYKELDVTFAVRGGPILNDVTVDDFHEVNMGEVASFISSENAVPGTILKDSSLAFQKCFQNADIVIAKGQGNFESLSSVYRNNLYLIFMSKCDYVSKTANVKTMDFVIKENKGD
jgi:uncharacterized protein with ATP-grasp and redox domains